EPVGGRLAHADAAVLAADAAQVVGDGVAAEQRHLAGGGAGSDGHLQPAGRAVGGGAVGGRLGLGLGGGRALQIDHGHQGQLVGVVDAVERGHEVGDVLGALGAAVGRL